MLYQSFGCDLGKLGFGCAELENCIERAKRYQTGNQENRAENQQDDPQSTSYGPAEVQVCQDNCEDKANNPVERSNVLFHVLTPIG